MDDILDVEMQPNDANAKTIRGYLKALVQVVWEQEEGFSGKRPFGNSGWQYDLALALVRAGKVEGKIDSNGCLIECDDAAVNEAIHEAIDAL